MVTNPLTRKKERRVIVNSISEHKVILLKKSEVRSCINFYITKCKGLGARKVYYSMSKKFCGISEREIQHHINRNAKHQRLHPAFTNKAPLNPVESSGVFNHVQIDLVSMERFPCVVNDKSYPGNTRCVQSLHFFASFDEQESRGGCFEACGAI